MAGPMIDNGPTSQQLSMSAWVLGASSLGGWLFLAQHIGDKGGAWDSASAVALAVGVTCSVLSACCALLVAIKTADRRIRQSLGARNLTTPS